MAIRVPGGLNITTQEPVDARIVLTKAEMRAVADSAMPAVYFCVCSEDKKLYIYNKSASASAETGKFTLYDTGGSGTGDKYFKFEQQTNATTWTIKHNLNKYPSVTTVKDYGGNELIGDVIYTDENNLKINFSIAVSGYAFLN